MRSGEYIQAGVNGYGRRSMSNLFQHKCKFKLSHPSAAYLEDIRGRMVCASEGIGCQYGSWRRCERLKASSSALEYASEMALGACCQSGQMRGRDLRSS